jgi:hypothetical protein
MGKVEAVSEDVKTVAESLRHANCQVTMDVYTQAIPKGLCSAQAEVAEGSGCSHQKN